MGFDLSNYEQVKDRITRFYSDHPDGRILTELVTAPAELGTHASFKALVYLGDTLKATGYAYEAQGQGVNRDAWVENCETSAIGRALANMDYCGSLRPSQEEMSKVNNKPPSAPPAKDQCSQLADNLKLSGDERKQMYNDAGQNYSNLLIMLKAIMAERDDKMAHIDDTLAKVFEAGK
jgi:hypothetical protein